MEDEESDNASLLSEIGSFLSCSEDAGPPNASALTDIINGKFDAKYSVKKRKDILQKYRKPSKCDNVLVLKVNKEIWGKLPTNAKRSDTRTSALQDTLVKVSSAITRLPITRTLANSNLVLTRINFPFLSGHFLYNFTLDNSNSRYY